MPRVRIDRQEVSKPIKERRPVAGVEAGREVLERVEPGAERPRTMAPATPEPGRREEPTEPDRRIMPEDRRTEQLETELGKPISRTKRAEIGCEEPKGAGAATTGRTGPGTERELGGVSPAANGELSIDELSSLID